MFRCSKCGNENEFTIVEELEFWDAEKRKWVELTNGVIYKVCDICGSSDIMKK